MIKYCSYCGRELKNNTNICSNCGQPIAYVQTEINRNNTFSNTTPIVTKKEIVIAVLFSILTCGLYMYYWIATMTNDANKISGENVPAGGTVILFSILTCGIYLIYWNYKMGKKIYNAGVMSNKPINDNSTLYLILSILGLSLINLCLMQNDLNQFAR